MDVIAVGTGTIDVIHEVDMYPKEDSKTRSLASYKCRGGNAANALVVCSQLGGRCRWLSTSTDPENDSDAKFIHADLAAFNVDCSLAVIEKEGSMPVSYIVSSQATGSRTIVHSHTIAELTYEAFVRQVEPYMTQDTNVWLHFEGRNMETVRQMMLYVRENAARAKVSVEIEFPRYPWGLAKTLASLADYVFLSKDYLYNNVCISNASDFFAQIQRQQWGENWNQWVKAFVCPWGSEGVYYLEMAGSTIHHIPSAQLDRVVESNGAGDSFIGAALAGLSRGNVPLHVVFKTACHVATFKCSQHGFHLPTRKVLEWKRALQYFKQANDTNAVTSNNHQGQANAESVVPTEHSVTSEVVLELDRAECRSRTDTDSFSVFVVPLLPTFTEDDDGDVIVPRRKTKTQRDTETVFVLAAHSRTTWDTAGTQLWRAAFLLAEYIYSAPEVFAGHTVLEFGCGIGFTAIVASRVSRCIYATDLDESALLLAKKNIERNHSGDVKLRLLDWGESSLISTAVDSSATLFGWTSTDRVELEDLTVIIASDVFYDDTMTLVFLRALRRLMLQHNRAKGYVASERRSVFSAAAMRVVSLGYDTFQDHICLHSSSKSHVRVTENQVQCRLCALSHPRNADGDILRFVVHEIETREIPRRFKYDRLATLMLWKIDAVVV
ncbi:unnamed protein product [Peronospora belbahrii]|uniref:Carbohydrate kinase PfkB domain-containing protein n=1 Tax=Peronospora belbahrii TaxID=622444 RepID=A0AAU9LBA3_9STRA|nr:unnamed protein product [Peronospora belbahrii]